MIVTGGLKAQSREREHLIIENLFPALVIYIFPARDENQRNYH